MTFAESMARYEAMMLKKFGASLVRDDLDEKHRKMVDKDSAFPFLRGSCFWWSENAETLCSEFMKAAPAPSVGDAHVANFGLWRDAQARLVWGVNDFDEAARTPWPLDLVRLAASAILAVPNSDSFATASAILKGYGEGLANPGALVLEGQSHALWLRDAFVADDGDRKAFWAKLFKTKPRDCDPPSLATPLLAAFGRPTDVLVGRRSAGVGSLGRPRFVAVGDVNGDPFAVEIKASLPSCWEAYREKGLAERTAHGRWRSPSPILHYDEGAGFPYVIRGLAPDTNKLEFAQIEARLSDRPGDVLAVMGAELASIHSAESDASRQVIDSEFRALKPEKLSAAASRVANWTSEAWTAYRGAS